MSTATSASAFASSLRDAHVAACASCSRHGHCLNRRPSKFLRRSALLLLQCLLPPPPARSPARCEMPVWRHAPPAHGMDTALTGAHQDSCVAQPCFSSDVYCHLRQRVRQLAARCPCGGMRLLLMSMDSLVNGVRHDAGILNPAFTAVFAFPPGVSQSLKVSLQCLTFGRAGGRQHPGYA